MNLWCVIKNASKQILWNWSVYKPGLKVPLGLIQNCFKWNLRLPSPLRFIQNLPHDIKPSIRIYQVQANMKLVQHEFFHWHACFFVYNLCRQLFLYQAIKFVKNWQKLPPKSKTAPNHGRSVAHFLEVCFLAGRGSA